MSFEQALTVEPVVIIAGRRHVVEARDVRSVELELRQAGFSGSVEFVRRDDAAYGGAYEDRLAQTFWDPQELEVELSVTPARLAPGASAEASRVSLRGRGERRGLLEQPVEREGRPMLERRYRVEFGDAARVLWSQHFPCELLTGKSLLEVVQAQATQDVRVDSSWEVATTTQRQWFLHLPEHAGSSFYDFLSWYLDGRGGGLSYDYAKGSYELVATPDVSHPAKSLNGDDFSEVRIDWREPPRARPRVRCASATASSTLAVERDHVLTPLARDSLTRTPIRARQSARADDEKLRNELPKPWATVVCRRYPSVALLPGARVSCVSEGLFSDASALVQSEWLVRSVRLRAVALSGPKETSPVLGAAPLTIDLSVALGQIGDRTMSGWDFVSPRYPGYVEGVVVSHEGADTEETWDARRDDDTALDEVEVEIPLFEESVFCPFEPGTSPASVFSPHCRGEPVLLALDLDESTIVRSLSWRRRVALAEGAQGEGVIFGRSEDNCTKLSHVYEGAVPVLGLERVNDKDHVTLTMSEGKLVIGVMEEGG